MVRNKASPPPPTSEPASLNDVVFELKDEVRTLRQQIEVLVAAIDDVRQEIETAICHLPRQPWVPTQPITSLPRDPLADPFPVNRTRREDVPAETTFSRPAPPLPIPQPVPAELPALPKTPKNTTEELF